MTYPNTSWPASVDASVSRTDGVDVVYADDFNYPDEQIRTIQSWLGGTHGALIGDDGTATHGPGGLVSPIGSGGVGIKLATRAAFSAGKILSVGEDYDSSYAERLHMDSAGLLTVSPSGNYETLVTAGSDDAIPNRKYVTDAIAASSGVWGRSGTVLSPATAGDTLTVGVGAVGSPGYSFETYTDTGIYLVSTGPDVVGIACDGATVASFSAAQMLNVYGTVGAPGYSFASDPDSGLYGLGGDVVAIAGGGEQYASWGPFYSSLSTGADQGGLEVTLKQVVTAAHGAGTVAQIQTNGVDAAVANAAYTRLDFDCISDVAGAEEGAVSINVANGTSGALAEVAVIGRYGLRTVDGAVGTPAYSFTGYTDTGVYLVSNTPDVVGISCDGAKVASFSATQMLNVAGSAAAPGSAFTTDPDTGVFTHAADTLSFGTGGALRFYITSAGFVGNGGTGSARVTRAAGSVGAPTYSFVGNTDSGMWYSAETRPDTSTIDTLHFSTDGTLRTCISSTGLRVANVTEATATAMDAGNDNTAKAGDLLCINDETSGFTLAYYDGTDWRRVQDRAVIS